METDQHRVVIPGDFWQGLQTILFAVLEKGILSSQALSFALYRTIFWKESRQRNQLHLYKIITLMQRLSYTVFTWKEMPVKTTQPQRQCQHQVGCPSSASATYSCSPKPQCVSRTWGFHLCPPLFVFIRQIQMSGHVLFQITAISGADEI